MFIVDKMFNQNQSPTDLNIDIDVAGGKREDALVIGIIALLLQNLYFFNLRKDSKQDIRHY